ncbi:MAG: hypothetical protein WCV83_02135 [Candidatus Magasanikbacteria bacterium]
MKDTENGGLSKEEMDRYFPSSDRPTDREGVLIDTGNRPRRTDSVTPKQDDEARSRENREKNNFSVLSGDLDTINTKIKNFLTARRGGSKDTISTVIIRDMAEAIIDKMNNIRRNKPGEEFTDIQAKLDQLTDGLDQMGMRTFADNYFKSQKPPMRKAA